MTEPENFDDELFADLYNDDEPSKSAPSQPAVDQFSAVQSAAAVEDNNNNHNYEQQDDNHQYQQYHNGDDSHMNNNEDIDDDDDEVDFNLGNGPATTASAYQDDSQSGYNSNNAPPPPPSQVKGPNSKEDGKMFIGGLNWETTDESLRDYFSQFGEVIECTVMRDGTTGRSRGFGFLTFKDPKTVNIVMVKEHHLDGKIIDPKRAIPRDEQERTSKIFVGGVSQETTDHQFREYFSQFGRVVDATLMMDKDTGRPRGFGFVTFESEAGVDACLSANLEIHGKPIEVKKAQPRGNLREEEEARPRGGPGGGKFGRKGPQGNNGNGGYMDDGSGGQAVGGGAGGGGGAPGGMTPQVMAQYFQRMQQAFQVMQSQMNMTRNMNNPAMMQQMMQMQQIQQIQAAQMMAAQRGGPGVGPAAANPMAAMAAGGGNMNPAMMQQMQQMMNQQGGGMPGGPVGAMSPAGPGAGANRPAYNAFEQQQFEQQKYETRGGARGGRGGGGSDHGGFSGNAQVLAGGGPVMGGGGGYGGPTSWEGMYDDVPQPMMAGGSGGSNFGGSQGSGNGGGGGRGYHKSRGGQNHGMMSPGGGNPNDPAHAPPANAPTGPKNPGRPGANYRGGGRGGNRGFHPYQRG